MAIQMRDLMMGALAELRIHPVEKWIRASVGDAVLVDTRRAALVWEPRRVVPSYAVPRDDVAGELVPFAGDPGGERPVQMGRDGLLVLDPRTPFSVHTCPGESLTIRTAAGDLTAAAFSPGDQALTDYVVLDWNAFSQWFEEEAPVMGHPHDPFDRIDCLPSSRRITLVVDGRVVAETERATLLFETPLPVRYYIPRADVDMDLLRPSTLRTLCAYKGTASYWSVQVDDRLLPNLAWTYEKPLHDALPVTGLIAFFTERLDLMLDGVRAERPVTPWS
ncbi:MAG TPA: DUF427 domain-containing protein [Nocardioidaceae bacterium]